MLELGAVRALLATRHVIAGGGGGIALSGPLAARCPRAAVVDKDHVAALLGIALDARRLVFVTDVSHAFDGFGGAGAAPIPRMRAAEARARLARCVFAPGSMQLARAPRDHGAVGHDHHARRGDDEPLGGVRAA